MTNSARDTQKIDERLNGTCKAIECPKTKPQPQQQTKHGIIPVDIDEEVHQSGCVVPNQMTSEQILVIKLA